ncbi:hypothetical protein BJ742DRAFT_857105 [Cladochytrium replicatum]|nr:hypothetical protein BJ742DRAFT_857105 [Cladochytrium replicatum]
MSTVVGWVVIGVATTISAFGTLYSAYRASKEPKVFNWILSGSFALMFLSDVLGFVFALLPLNPAAFIRYLVIFDMALSLNILATAVKTICNLVRFEGVFHSILTTTRFPYRTWMNHALVAITTIITLFAITIAWVIDFYPYYHVGKQLTDLPAQFNGGVVAGGIASVWLVSVDLSIAILSLLVVRMLRKKWRTLKQRRNIRSERTAGAGRPSTRFNWTALGMQRSYVDTPSNTQNSRLTNHGGLDSQLSQKSAASLREYPELQSFKLSMLADNLPMKNELSSGADEEELVSTSTDVSTNESPSKWVFLNAKMPISTLFAQRQRTFEMPERSEPKFSPLGSIQPSIHEELSTSTSSGVSSRSSYPHPLIHVQKNSEPKFTQLGSIQPSLYPPSTAISSGVSSRSSEPPLEIHMQRQSEPKLAQPSLYPPSLVSSAWGSTKSSYTPHQPTEVSVESTAANLPNIETTSANLPSGTNEIVPSAKRTRFDGHVQESLARVRTPVPTIYDDRSERGVRTMYWIFTFQILIPIIVVPFFLAYSANLFISGITTIFLRIYNLIILEYIYLIRTVVHYTSIQAMDEASTDNIGVPRSKTSNGAHRGPVVGHNDDMAIEEQRDTNVNSGDQSDTVNLSVN